MSRKVPNAFFWQRRRLGRLMRTFWHNLDENVSPVFIDPLNTYVGSVVEIGDKTTIEPNAWIMGETVIGKNCRIGFGSIIIDSVLEDNVTISGARIEKSRIGHHAEIGYTAQLKRTQFGAYSKMVHRGYLGDAVVGEHVNIGADVTTANYDGTNKNKTVIGNNAFIGTGVNLVAPIEIPEGMMIASGSTVTAKDPKEPWRLLIARPQARLSRSRRVVKDEKGWRLEEVAEEKGGD